MARSGGARGEGWRMQVVRSGGASGEGWRVQVVRGGGCKWGGWTLLLAIPSSPYPFTGRASASPVIDVFITLLSLGWSGYKELRQRRKVCPVSSPFRRPPFPKDDVAYYVEGVFSILLGSQ